MFATFWSSHKKSEKQDNASISAGSDEAVVLIDPEEEISDSQSNTENLSAAKVESNPNLTTSNGGTNVSNALTASNGSNAPNAPNASNGSNGTSTASTSSKRGRKKKGRKKKKIEELQVVENVSAPDVRKSSEGHERSSLWSQVCSLVGTDPISLASLPVWIFEPTTFLQRMAEPFAFSELLDKAGDATDPIDRLSFIAAWTVAILSITVRTGKPFNPVLGETFEYSSKDRNFHFIAEQVSHHPPIGVGATKGQKWYCKQEAHVKTKFWGNSVEVFAVGPTILHFTDGDHFVWHQPNCCAHNILIGGMWFDYWGEIEISSKKSSEKCWLRFHKYGGIFHRNSYQKVTGEILDAEGKSRVLLMGKWGSHFAAQKVDSKGKKIGDEYFLWQNQPFTSDNKWGLPPYTKSLIAMPTDFAVLPTDSRLRGDLQALLVEDLDLASKEKHRIEQDQRLRRKKLSDEGKTWVPQHFKEVSNPAPDEHHWELKEEYWKRL